MSDNKVIDFVAKRDEAIEKKRRSFERVVFDNFLGMYSVIDDHESVYGVELLDISEEGCLFQVPASIKDKKKFKTNREVKLRLYFTEQNYIPALVKIKYGKKHKDHNGSEYMRYGCQFDKSVSSFEALQSFIKFIYKFAEHSCIDRGDQKVYFL